MTSNSTTQERFVATRTIAAPPAAVFSVLRKVPLPSRLRAIIEAESGFSITDAITAGETVTVEPFSGLLL